MVIHTLPLILKPIISPLLKAVIALRLHCLLFLLLLKANHHFSDPLIGHEMVGQFLPDLVNTGVMRVIQWFVLEIGLIGVCQVSDEKLPLEVEFDVGVEFQPFPCQYFGVGLQRNNSALVQIQDICSKEELAHLLVGEF